MSLGWQVLVIIAAGAIGSLVYCLLVGGENVRAAFRELDNDRRRDGG